MHEKTKKVGKEDQNYFTILTSLYTMITCIYRLFFWHQLLTFYINTKVEGIKFFFFYVKDDRLQNKGYFCSTKLTCPYWRRTGEVPVRNMHCVLWASNNYLPIAFVWKQTYNAKDNFVHLMKSYVLDAELYAASWPNFNNRTFPILKKLNKNVLSCSDNLGHICFQIY